MAYLINTPDSINGQFIDLDPQTGGEGTGIIALWLNNMQGEVANVVTGLGLTLDSTQTNQVITGLNNTFMQKSNPLAFGVLTLGQLNNETAGLEIGSNIAGSTPYIDFHSNSDNAAYDTRILASGGGSSQGQGTLTLIAATVAHTGAITVAGASTFNALVTATDGLGTNSLGVSGQSNFAGASSFQNILTAFGGVRCENSQLVVDQQTDLGGLVTMNSGMVVNTTSNASATAAFNIPSIFSQQVTVDALLQVNGAITAQNAVTGGSLGTAGNITAGGTLTVTDQATVGSLNASAGACQLGYTTVNGTLSIGNGNTPWNGDANSGFNPIYDKYNGIFAGPSGISVYNATNPSLNAGCGAAGNAILQFYGNGGAIGAVVNQNNQQVSYGTTSDYRLKTNVTPIRAADAVKRIQTLKPVDYEWKSDNSQGRGFIAHEYGSVVLDGTIGEKDKVDADGGIVAQQVDLSRAVPDIVSALQNALMRIEALEAQIKPAPAK